MQWPTGERQCQLRQTPGQQIQNAALDELNSIKNAVQILNPARREVIDNCDIVALYKLACQAEADKA